MAVTMENIKDEFGQGVRVISPIRCWDAITKDEIVPPLDRPINELLWRDLIFAFKGANVVVCTSKAALEAAKSEKKVLLEDVIKSKRPSFNFERSLSEWI